MLLTMENYRSMKTESKSDIFLSLICLAGLRELIRFTETVILKLITSTKEFASHFSGT